MWKLSHGACLSIRPGYEAQTRYVSCLLLWWSLTSFWQSCQRLQVKNCIFPLFCLLGDIGEVPLLLRSPLSCSFPCQYIGLLLQYRCETAQRFSWPCVLLSRYEQEWKENTRPRHCVVTLLPVLSSTAETWSSQEQAATATEVMECNRCDGV